MKINTNHKNRRTPTPGDTEFEKVFRRTMGWTGWRKSAWYIWRKAQDVQMQRDFEIAYKEDKVAAWEIRAGFDKRRGIVRIL